MGPKVSLAEAFDGLYQDVIAYISYHVSIDEADESARKLLEAEQPEVPEYYVLYRQLKQWGGNSVRFLWDSNGYLDQPWLATRAIEVCISAEQEYKNIVARQKTNEQRLQESTKTIRN